MKINEPIGDASYAPLFIRLTMGSYFILAGWSKLHMLAAFIGEVKKLGVLSENLSSLYGTLLPYLEIFAGVTLFLGLWTTLGALIAALLLISFIAAFGLFPGDHIFFNKDVLLLGAVLSLLFSGGGRYSVDNVRRVGGTS